MTFDGTQKLIGRGAQAEVFLYHDYAYKVYVNSYPEEWIAFEKRQQVQVNKAGACPVKYYDTDDTHIIKMDLVKGEMLEERMLRLVGGADGASGPLQIESNLSEIIASYGVLSRAFEFVHSKDIKDIEIPHFKDTASSNLTPDEANRVIPVVERLSSSMKNVICHLDLHFENIMIPTPPEPFETSPYTIIDWVDARIAPAVFDYARTYAILEQAPEGVLELYKKVVLPQIFCQGVSESDFSDALEVSRIIRSHEVKN